MRGKSSIGIGLIAGVLAVAAVSAAPAGAAYPGVNGPVVFQAADTSLHALTLGGSGQVTLPDSGGGNRPSFSADGRWMAYQYTSGVAVRRTDWSPPVFQRFGSEDPPFDTLLAPALSPDGSVVAYSSVLEADHVFRSVFVQTVDGSGTATQIHEALYPTFDAEGNLYYSKDNDSDPDEEQWDIVKDPTFGPPEPVLSNPSIDELDPDISPDTKRIAYTFWGSGDPDVHEYDTTQDDDDPLVESGAYEVAPAYSPDGTKLAYLKDQPPLEGFPDEVFVLELGGSSTNLTNTPDAGEGPPGWSVPFPVSETPAPGAKPAATTPKRCLKKRKRKRSRASAAKKKKKKCKKRRRGSRKH